MLKKSPYQHTSFHVLKFRFQLCGAIQVIIRTAVRDNEATPPDQSESRIHPRWAPHLHSSHLKWTYLSKWG